MIQGPEIVVTFDGIEVHKLPDGAIGLVLTLAGRPAYNFEPKYMIAGDVLAIRDISVSMKLAAD